MRLSTHNGYYIYTNLSHPQKVKDLNRLSEAFGLGLDIKWDDEGESEAADVAEHVVRTSVFNEEASILKIFRAIRLKPGRARCSES